MTIRVHRLVAAGALTVAAVAAPIAIALTSADMSSEAQCRSWVTTNGSMPVCADGPDSGNSFTIGTPQIGVYGPNSGSGPAGGGIGVNTGPLLPGTSWNSQLPIS